jgi:hypothetical protein
MAFLGEVGCDELQGFLLGAPCSAEEMTRLLAARPSGDRRAVTPTKAVPPDPSAPLGAAAS